MREIMIGLECHCYLKMDNHKKLFCDCDINPEARPNANICPICTGMPGSKPMLPNEEAIRKIIAVALMLNCKVNENLLFQRKHYSWPDLPKGYQITMSGSYSVPVGENGNFLGIGIQEVHLEEDPAKWDPMTGFVDYNRSGFPLVEIVTKPDFESTNQLRDWLKKLITTLSYINAVDSTAGIKSDVNISVAPKFQRVEIKNINSFKSIVGAAEYESERQKEEIKEGREIHQETRAWDDKTGKTIFMRTKETAQDYMFIPEPDLPVVKVEKKLLKEISEKLPEKPDQKEKRYVKELKINQDDAAVISSEITLAGLFERIAKEVDPVLAAKWLRRELLRVLNYNKKELQDILKDEKEIIKLLKLIESGKVTENTAQKLLEKLIQKSFDVEEYVKKQGLVTISEKIKLEEYCKEVISKNPKAVEDYKKGKAEALNFLIGQVMKMTKGAASPKELTGIMMRLITKTL